MGKILIALFLILPAGRAYACQGKVLGTWNFDGKPRFMNLTIAPRGSVDGAVDIHVEHKRGSSLVQGTCELGNSKSMTIRWPEAVVSISPSGQAQGIVSKYSYEGKLEASKPGAKKTHFGFYVPVKVSADAINGRAELLEMNRSHLSPVTDRRWEFSEFIPPYVKPKFGGSPRTKIMMDRKIIAFMEDIRTAAKAHREKYEAGSEELFNVFDAYNPAFDELSSIDRALETATAAWLGNPAGRAFFAITPSGKSLRRIFNKIRRAPRAKVEVSKLSLEEKETLGIFLGSTLWRIRGAGFIGIVEHSKEKRRYFVEYGFQSLGALVGKDVSSIASDFRWRLQLKGWGRYFDMGNADGPEAEAGKDETYDLIKMTDRGLYQVENSLSFVAGTNGSPESLKIAGLHMGPCYLYAWREFIGLSDGSSEDPRYTVTPSEDNSRRRFPWFVNLMPRFATPVGELCTGAALGLGIVRSFTR